MDDGRIEVTVSGQNYELTLDECHWMYGQRAVDAFVAGDSDEFCFTAKDASATLGLVRDNIFPLKRRGMYERCLFNAFPEASNWSGWSLSLLEYMFKMADRDALLALGKPVGPAPITVYRGVAGSGKKRRVRGFSWTTSIDVACWFANRFACLLGNPAVYQATLNLDEIYFSLADDVEHEIVGRPARTKNLNLSVEEIAVGSRRHLAQDRLGCSSMTEVEMACHATTDSQFNSGKKD